MNEVIKKYLPGFLIVFFVLFSMVPTFYEWMERGNIRPIRYFELVHNFPTDYNLYLSKIRQGKEGAWLAREKYTAEPHEGSLSQVLYVLLGRISDWSHIQTPYIWFTYHLARVFYGILLLFMMWKIVQWVFPTFSWQILSFLLVTTASTWPKFETVDGWPRFGGYMPWYTVIDSMQRTTFLPHVMLGQALLIFIIWVFAGGFVSRKHPGNWVFLGFVGIIVGIIFPPALLFLYGMLGFWTAFEVGGLLIHHKEVLTGNNVPKKLLTVFTPYFQRVLFGRIIFGVMTVPTLLYYALLFTQYPWKRLTEFDALHPTKFSYMEYFLALGATLLFGLVGGVIATLRLRYGGKDAIERKLPVFLVWVLSWLFFVFLFNFIPQQSPTRWSEMTPHVPLGILTAYAAYTGAKIFRILKKKIFLHTTLLIPVVIILLAFGTMFSSWLWQKDFVDHKLRADIPLVPKGAEVMYPLKDLVEAMIWLQVNTPRSAVVFSGEATGNMIPVYAGNTTHVGHANTVDSETKVIAVANFYGRKRPIKDFIDYFKKYKIQYVMYGPEEAELAYGAFDIVQFYPFLQEVYKNTMVIIYKVNLP